MTVRVVLFLAVCAAGFGCAAHTPPSLTPPGAGQQKFETVYTYAYALTEPVKQSRLEIRDGATLCRLIPREKEIGVEIYNLGDNPVVVDWDEVRFVDAQGLAHPVVHELVPLADISRRQTPSLILPQGLLSDTVAPKDYVYADVTGWVQRPIFPRTEAAMDLKGKTFGVVIPVRQEEAVTTFTLKFEVSDIRSFLVERK